MLSEHCIIGIRVQVQQYTILIQSNGGTTADLVGSGQDGILSEPRSSLMMDGDG
jgi:hypothetical protein